MSSPSSPRPETSKNALRRDREGLSQLRNSMNNFVRERSPIARRSIISNGEVRWDGSFIDFSASISAPPSGAPESLAIRRLMYEIEKLREFPVVGCTASPRDDNLLQWFAVIEGPKGTVYEDGTFFVDIFLTHEYPFVAPKVVFLTRIYHPNINSQGKVCMDRLTTGWTSCMSISTVLQSLISLLYDWPNCIDALVPSIAEQIRENPEEFKRMARIWTHRYAK
uniref:UBC core domain-containing protein n=1 Tax=Acrobeloides nanus TaxID=290746 RepID=A0A914DW63_9BILA